MKTEGHTGGPKEEVYSVLSYLKKKPIQISLFSGAFDSLLLLLVAMPLNSVPIEGTSAGGESLPPGMVFPKLLIVLHSEVV